MGIVQRWLEATESLDLVDDVAGVVQGKIRRLTANTVVERALGGSWLGHPVHPLAVQLPIGLWLSSAVLDLLGGHKGARQLIGAGLMAVPTAVATGLVDWSTLDVRSRRVGVIHALANVTASACFLSSYRCRGRGGNVAGGGWTLLGLMAVAAGGALGGHLSYAQGAGVYRWSRRV
jgi:hypothetical protein